MYRDSWTSTFTRGETWTGFASSIILIASLAMNVVQARQLRSVRRTEPQPQVGTPIGGMDLVTAAGQQVRLTYDESDRSTILYYFSPSCRWCERNWANVEALANATTDRYRFVAVTAAAAGQASAGGRPRSFEVYGGLSERDRRAAGLGGTPHTIVISPTGLVQRAWMGTFRGENQREIEAYFGVTLPGVPPS